MARMRYAKEAVSLIQQEDPGSPITVNYIRTLAASGKIPVVQIGRRKLINVDALQDYLQNPEPNREIDGSGPSKPGGIRPVPLR